MEPIIIEGNSHEDLRGKLIFNNDFDTSDVKRVYTVQNIDSNFVRAWQGHKIEQRWFSAVEGCFIIELIKIDFWENPSKDLRVLEFNLSAENFDVLYIPAGFISSIKSGTNQSKLLVFADHFLGEINDEYRFATDYFN